MALAGKTIFCVVPARGGSKSIPGKNLVKIGGVSLVGRAAQIAGTLSWLDARIISTDDATIAKEARAYGLDVPFMRPPELSSDTATSLDMWRHAWHAAEKEYGMRLDVSLLLEPTSPLRTTEDVERAALCVARDGHSAAVTVTKAPAHYTPEKTLKLDAEGHIAYYIGKKGLSFHNRQSIPDYYYRNGVCYAVSRTHLMDEGKIIENALPVVINRPLVNIDDPFELELADWLLERQNRRS